MILDFGVKQEVARWRILAAAVQAPATNFFCLGLTATRGVEEVRLH